MKFNVKDSKESIKKYLFLFILDMTYALQRWRKHTDTWTDKSSLTYTHGKCVSFASCGGNAINPDTENTAYHTNSYWNLEIKSSPSSYKNNHSDNNNNSV